MIVDNAVAIGWFQRLGPLKTVVSSRALLAAPKPRQP
jgi:hypothetical protein